MMTGLFSQMLDVSSVIHPIVLTISSLEHLKQPRKFHLSLFLFSLQGSFTVIIYTEALGQGERLVFLSFYSKLAGFKSLGKLCQVAHQCSCVANQIQRQQLRRDVPSQRQGGQSELMILYFRRDMNSNRLQTSGPLYFQRSKMLVFSHFFPVFLVNENMGFNRVPHVPDTISYILSA